MLAVAAQCGGSLTHRAAAELIADRCRWRRIVRLNSCRPMTNAVNLDLQRAIDRMAVPGILVAHRVIASGDELALLPEELPAFSTSVTKVRRASGAARIVARELLRKLGLTEQPVPKSSSGAPVWPRGIVGSLAHDSEIALAAIARRHEFLSLGVDVEPAEALEPDLLGLIASASERDQIRDDPCNARLLFAVKEAVYKAVHPLDGVFLEHHDVEVDLASRTARVRNGRLVRFRYSVAAHLLVLAFIPASPEAN
jgi:4'-phosphopantetheinyl transferase EntD